MHFPWSSVTSYCTPIILFLCLFAIRRRFLGRGRFVSKYMLMAILISVNNPFVRLVHTFLDIGPSSNLLYTPPPELPTSLFDHPQVRGTPRSINTDSAGNVVLITESNVNLCNENHHGIQLNVMHAHQLPFNHVICDENTDVYALASVSDPVHPGMYVAYLVNEKPAYINIDRFDLAARTLNTILVLNQTDTQPFSLSAVGVVSADASTTRLFAAGNEVVWFLDHSSDMNTTSALGAEVALMYPVGTTVYAIGATTLSNDIIDTQLDFGLRLYALIESENAFFMHMQDGLNSELNVFDVDLNLNASTTRLYQSVVIPRLSPDSSPYKPRAMHHGLHVCKDTVFLLYTRSGVRALNARSFSAVDLTPIAMETTLLPTAREPDDDMGLVYDLSCDHVGGSLVLLSTTATSHVDSLIYVSPDLKIKSMQQFGKIIKPVPRPPTSSITAKQEIQFRRIGLALGQNDNAESFVTMLQAEYEPARPDLVPSNGTQSNELLLGAMANVDCAQLNIGNPQQPVPGRDMYSCAPCTGGGSTGLVKLTEIDTPKTCLYYQSNQSSSTIIKLNTTCSPPDYFDTVKNQCVYCAGESNGVTCLLQQADDANQQRAEQFNNSHSGVVFLIGAVGCVGALIGGLGGLIYHRHAAVNSGNKVAGARLPNPSMTVKEDVKVLPTLDRVSTPTNEISAASNKYLLTDSAPTSTSTSPTRHAKPNDDPVPMNWIPPPPPAAYVSTISTTTTIRSTYLLPHSRSHTALSSVENTLYHADHLPTVLSTQDRTSQLQITSSTSVPVNLHALLTNCTLTRSIPGHTKSMSSSIHTLSRSVPVNLNVLAKPDFHTSTKPKKKSLSILIHNELNPPSSADSPYGPWATKEMIESGILGALPVPYQEIPPPIPSISHSHELHSKETKLIDQRPYPKPSNRNTNPFDQNKLSYLHIHDSHHDLIFNPDQEDISGIIGSESVLSIIPPNNSD